MTVLESAIQNLRPPRTARLEPGSVLPIARYRFSFRMEEELLLPEYAGSLLRGQFGAALRRTVCMTGEKHCPVCPLYRTCPYPAIFETPPPESHPLQTFSDVPNPYVIEPPVFGTRYVPTGAEFSFRMVLVGDALGQLPLIAFALQRAFRHGMGKRRARARLQDIRWEAGDESIPAWEQATARILPHPACLTVPSFAPTQEIRLRFSTPLRLQNQGRPLAAAELRPRTLVTALMRRASLLFDIHADMPGIAGDATALARHAEEIRDERELRWLEWTRFSIRQGQKMTLGGVVGDWVLRGELEPLMPWLWLGQWLHVGKNATMGMGSYSLEVGRLAIEPCARPDSIGTT